jgi:DNA-binding GntR family transcriptional regulator
LFEPAESHHLLRLIGSLWDATGSYRALYYNLEGERRAADEAHARILAAARAGAVDELVAELDHHRSRAIQTLAEILGED